MKTLKTVWFILLLSFFFTTGLFAQNEANLWYWGIHCGLGFNTDNGNDISHFTMEVYDRWGGRIFRSENILLGWDGKKNGNDCPGGVYVYKIVFSVEGVAGNQERVGTVVLVR